MRTSTAHERHRAHHTRERVLRRPWIVQALRARLPAGVAAAAAGVLLLTGLALTACASLPRPPAARVSASDYVPVPSSPRIPPVEYIPPRPSKSAVWVDGSWEWTGRRYAWRFGTWTIPPPNARLARWVVVRREGDGQLFFAPSTWKDATGKAIEDRSFLTALGPEARARSRLGGPPAGSAPRPNARDERSGSDVVTRDADDD